MTDLFLVPTPAAPPDQAQRSRALDLRQSFLVQAPAGSGKTQLLTQRFLGRLAQAEKPDEIVAITFTNAAAAEMRQRILSELEKAERSPSPNPNSAPESLASLAQAALARSEQLGWQILDQPTQLRITTIDAFCRGLSLQCSLGWGPLSGLGGNLDVVENPQNLYRRAAHRTLDQLRVSNSPTRPSVEALLLWRDNNWRDVEDQIVRMLAERNRWYQDFVFARELDIHDWVVLRRRLEAPFRRAALKQLHSFHRLLDPSRDDLDAILNLARLACDTPGDDAPRSLARRTGMPSPPFEESLQEAAEAYRDLACFLLTQKDGGWRSVRGLKESLGFPSGNAGKAMKQHFGELVARFKAIPGLEAALNEFQTPAPIAYTEEEWQLVRHCFAVLREAAGQLQVVFAETGSADFVEVAQIALRVLADDDGRPSDFAIQQAEGIRHLLVDEFQDTSRNQHQLLSRLIAAWPDREGRSCFCVGDPMQSIYGFREAEVELFERLKSSGLEVTAPDGSNDPLHFEFVQLRANFRTQPSLVDDLNHRFSLIFNEDDGSGIHFTAAQPARPRQSQAKTELHLAFANRSRPKATNTSSPNPATPNRPASPSLKKS